MHAPDPSATRAAPLAAAIADRSTTVGVIGLGYVGLPLAATAAQAGFTTVGFDIDPEKVALLNAGASYIDAVPAGRLAAIIDGKRFRASTDFSQLAACGVIVICVPTPLTPQREPDLSFVVNTARTIARHLRPAQLIVLESTTFPGTTCDIVKPILKIVAGDGAAAQRLIESFYQRVVQAIVPVSSPAVAEAVKITENIFRAVNIALVNELKVIYEAMGIDVWEVIDAAATKPFGYMPFYPGPGLGGHCIPIDPFYLAWKSKEYELPTRFIELAGEINRAMPRYVIAKLEAALDARLALPLGRARVLIIGIAYKRNVADVRESPSFKLMKLIEERGAVVAFHDPHVTKIPPTREHADFAGRSSVPLDAQALRSCDCVLLAADHDAVDYALVARHAPLIIDTRNVFARNGLKGDHIVKA
jgi:UDP-N-acetyl-D-glucosamine dehydrogenase